MSATAVSTAATVESSTAAAVESTTTAVESSTAAVEPTATATESARSATTESTRSATAESARSAAEAGATMKAAIPATEAVIGMCDRTPEAYAAVSISPAVTVAASVSITPAVKAVVEVAATPEAMTPVAAIPRAGSDKDAAKKPARTVEAVRRAGVGIVAVVSVGANGSWTVVIPCISLVIILIVVALVILRLGARRQRQWRGQQAKREYPSKELLHIAPPIRPPFQLLTRMAVAVRGCQRLVLYHPTNMTRLACESCVKALAARVALSSLCLPRRSAFISLGLAASA